MHTCLKKTRGKKRKRNRPDLGALLCESLQLDSLKSDLGVLSPSLILQSEPSYSDLGFCGLILLRA